MKRTRIRFLPMGDKVKIISIKNIATKEELERELGLNGLTSYLKSGVHFYVKLLDGTVEVYGPGADYTTSGFSISSLAIILCPGCVLSKENFDWAIETMRAAGERLRKIRDSQIKEVVI